MPDQNQLTIVYEKASHKQTVAITGATGATSIDNLTVVLHTYVDSGSLPSYETHEVNEDGSVRLDNPDATKRGDVTREVQASLVMAPEVAVLVGRLLVQMGERAISGRGGQGNG